MVKAPKTPEQKKAMLDRLKAGKEKKSKERAEALAKGLPDPHPRKPRAKKVKDDVKKDDHILDEPLENKPDNDTIRGIDEATKEGTSNVPVQAEPVETKPIDVPALPKDKEKIVKDSVVKPTVKSRELTTTGKPKKINITELITNEETGNQVIPAQYAGQMASIKETLKKNKKMITTQEKPMPEHPNEISQSKTVRKVSNHIPDMKAVEGRKPFSFSAVKKLLYQ